MCSRSTLSRDAREPPDAGEAALFALGRFPRNEEMGYPAAAQYDDIAVESMSRTA